VPLACHLAQRQPELKGKKSILLLFNQKAIARSALEDSRGELSPDSVCWFFGKFSDYEVAQ